MSVGVREAVILCICHMALDGLCMLLPTQSQVNRIIKMKAARKDMEPTLRKIQLIAMK